MKRKQPKRKRIFISQNLLETLETKASEKHQKLEEYVDSLFADAPWRS